MNDKRLILYFALAFIVFTLWTNWTREHSPQTAATSSSVQPQTSTPSTSSTSSLPPSLQPAPSDRLVTVKTDVLEAKIDTLGGNIVYVGLLKYPEKLHSQDPMVLLNENPETYYIGQTGMTGEKGPDTQKALASYTSPQKTYELQANQNEIDVPLTWTDNKGVTITKTFKFKRDDYAVPVTYTVKNKSKTEWQGNIYSQIRKKPEPHHSTLQFSTFNGASYSSAEQPYEKISYKNMDKENLAKNIRGGWLATQQRYFLTAWVPNQQQTNHYFTNVDPDNQIYTIGYVGPTLTVQPDSELATTTTLYTGPELENRLKPVAPHLDLTIDFGWLWWLSVPILWLMEQIYKFIGNWGWAIILVTVLIKAVFYKLSEMSYRSMARMRLLQPKLEEIKKRYGEDRQKLNQATMEMYRKEKINPLGGCLPILIQVPVFIALYYVLVESVQLRQAPFMLWIQDLSSKDPYFILPILMGISMWAQQRLNPPPPDPVQARVMQFLPVVLTVLFLSFPSGLVLYWLTNNILSILQQWYITKSMEGKLQAKKKTKKK